MLSVIMSLELSIVAFASENNTIDLDAALMEKGYPQIVLDTMDEDAKLDIYNAHNATFAGAVISYYDELSDTFTNIQLMRMEVTSPREGKFLNRTLN